MTGYIAMIQKGGKRRCSDYENDISAEKETEKESAWFQKKNEYSGRKESSGSQTSKGKKEIIRIGHSIVTFFLL